MGPLTAVDKTGNQVPLFAQSAGGVATQDVNGQGGVRVTTDTVAVTGNFTSIQILEDATFSVFTETGAAGSSMTGFVIPAGLTLFGKITGYTLSSGKVRAYA